MKIQTIKRDSEKFINSHHEDNQSAWALKFQERSLRRRISLLYSKIYNIVKILLYVFFLIYITTDFVLREKSKSIEFFGHKLAKFGIVLDNIHMIGVNNINVSEILFNLEITRDDPLILLDIHKLRNQLLTNPWIEDVVVSRRLPNNIIIDILEKRPIAIWQYNKQIYLIDANGRVIKVDDIQKFKHLPYVIGKNANVYALKMLNDLHNNFPTIMEKMLYAIRHGDRRWDIVLIDYFVIKAPEDENFLDALQYASNFLKNESNIQIYKSLDLRNKDKYFTTLRQ